MKEQILQQIGAVINALGTITVSGKQNCGNIVGSISILEQIIQQLSVVEFAPDENGEDQV